MLPRRALMPAVLLSLPLALPAMADEVIDWNNVALDAIRAGNTNPPRATRGLAMIHAAVFDAVNGIEEVYEPYHVRSRAPAGASPEAAAVTAAYEVLRKLYPDMKDELGDRYEASMDAIPNGSAKNKGRSWGKRVARDIIALRKRDGADATVSYKPSGEFGRWKPTPPGFASALLPQWPYVTPFAMPSGDALRAPAPPDFTSEEHAEAYNEVKDYGGMDSAARTEDQTVIAYFWEDGPGTVTPPGHWQVIAQQLSAEHDLTLLENARLFALLSFVQADGAICSWDNKYHHDFVRPYTGITEEADDDGNPDTESDPTWFNLIPTPPFPSYTSGHSTFSGGSSRLLAHFFGSDDFAFCAESPDPQRWPDVLPGVVRCWDSLSQAAEEAGQSRVYGGIHWQYDNQWGLNNGRDLADYVFENFLTGPTCLGDVTGDGVVDISDIFAVLTSWGRCDDCDDCPADLDGDCRVRVNDLLIVVFALGEC